MENKTNQLTLMVKDNGLEKNEEQKLISSFSDYELMAKDWEEKARSIVVTNESQTAEMNMAKAGRLFLAKKRIDVERTRKELKEQSLRKGQVIDSIAKFLVSLIEPTEKYLKEQEDFVKIQEEKKLEELRVELEKKEEQERIEKEKSEKEEQEKIRIENENLRKEAVEREKAIELERQKQQEELKAKQAEADATLKKEREEYRIKQAELEEISRKEREESARLAKIEQDKRDKIIAEQKAEADRRAKVSIKLDKDDIIGYLVERWDFGAKEAEECAIGILSLAIKESK